MKKILVLWLILCLQACATNERTKIIESNIKDMQVYTEDGELICKELPCPVKFDKETGESQKIKLKVDGFEGEKDIAIKIWQGERNIRRAGSISNVVLYPISAADASIYGVTTGPTAGSFAYACMGGDSLIIYSSKGTTHEAKEAFITQAQMVNEIWFYDPDHIYIDARLCDKKKQCIYPHEIGYKGYGYKKSNPNEDLIIKESKTYFDLIKKDEIITKRFVLHNYTELKADSNEYMDTLKDLTGLDSDKLREIIKKAKSAPELAETLSRYSKKK